MRAVLLFLIMLSNATAQAQGQTCARLFATPDATADANPTTELIHLRLEIDKQQALGNREIARLLYGNYQTLHATAVSQGQDLTRFEEQLRRARNGESAHKEVTQKQHDRVRLQAEQDVRLFVQRYELKMTPAEPPMLLSPDGKHLLYERKSEDLVLRNLEDQQEQVLNKVDWKGIFKLEANWNQGFYLTRLNSNSRYEVRSLTDGTLLQKGQANLVSIAKKADLMVIERDKQIELTTASTGQFLKRLDPPWKNRTFLRRLAFSPNGKELLLNTISETLIYDIANETYETMPHHSLYDTALSPVDTRAVVNLGPAGQVVVIDRADPQVAVPLQSVLTHLEKIWFSADGEKIFAQSTKPATFSVWNSRTGERLRSFQEVDNTAETVTSEDGSTLAYQVRASYQTTIKIFAAPKFD